MIARWNDFWFRETSARGVIVARILVAANALWLLLSRIDLVSVRAWPAELWSGVPRGTMIRYGYLFPVEVERVLYWVAVAALVAVLLGFKTRVDALISGLLLYHLAPLENVVGVRIGPYFNGFTLPVLALLILAFAPASEFRWPFKLIQTLFLFTYLLAGLSKLRNLGLQWAVGENIRGTIEVFNAFEPARRPLADYLLANPWLCTLIGIATIVLEVLAFFVLFSARIARIAVVVLVIAHIGIYLTLGVAFLNFPLVLLLLHWDEAG